MTGEELKEALYTRCPVIAHIKGVGDMRYKYVESIVYRRGGFRDNYRVILTVGLMDYNGNSITYTAAKNVRKDEEAQKKYSRCRKHRLHKKMIERNMSFADIISQQNDICKGQKEKEL